MPLPAYLPGRPWAICQRCGRQRRHDEMNRDWTNSFVCHEGCWDPTPAQMSPPKVWPEGVPIANPSPVPPYIFVDPGDITAEDL